MQAMLLQTSLAIILKVSVSLSYGIKRKIATSFQP